MRLLSVPLALAILSPCAVAQCFDPVFGTPIGGALLLGEVVLPIQSIGFAFPLAGTTYTDVHITTKGQVYLSNAGVPTPPAFTDFTVTAAEFASQQPCIAPLWGDYLMNSFNVSEVYLKTSAGICTITWENIVCFANCTAFTMQASLLPSGEVFMHWRNGATNNSSTGQATWQVGLTGISPGALAANASLDLSAGGVATDNLIHETFATAGSFDMDGRSLQFIPLNPGWFYTDPTNCAAASNYGTGCGGSSGVEQVYEFFGAGWDLDNTTISFFRTGTGYTMLTAVPGTFVPPSVTAQQIQVGVLDGQQAVTLSAPMPIAGGVTTTLNITTKGQIELGTPSAAFVDFTPSIAEFDAWAQTAVMCWHDWDQSTSGSGQIFFEEVGGIAYVTWNAVESYLTTLTSTFQFQLNIATGDIQLVMLTLGGVTNPDPVLVGYTTAALTTGGGVDFSTVGSVILADAVGGDPNLGLSTNDVPTIGNAAFTLDIAGVPNILPLSFLYFGTPFLPGFDLSGFNLPGCNLYNLLEFASYTVPISLPAGTGSFNLAIPPNPAIAGTVWGGQAWAFSLVNAGNLILSNGVYLRAGF